MRDGSLCLHFSNLPGILNFARIILKIYFTLTDRCNLLDGTIVGVLEMPVPQVTSCAFGGPDRNLLFITTAARNLDLNEFPLAGGVFCAKTSVTGQASPRFKG